MEKIFWLYLSLILLLSAFLIFALPFLTFEVYDYNFAMGLFFLSFFLLAIGLAFFAYYFKISPHPKLSLTEKFFYLFLFALPFVLFASAIIFSSYLFLFLFWLFPWFLLIILTFVWNIKKNKKFWLCAGIAYFFLCNYIPFYRFYDPFWICS